MALPAFSGTLGPKRAAHLLHRASGGPTKELIDSFASLTAPQAVAELFKQPLTNPTLPVNPDTGEEWFLSGKMPDKILEFDFIDIFRGWIISQLIAPGQPISYSVREKVVFFIHTVITTIITKVDDSRSSYFQNELFRQFAFDKSLGPKYNFKELTKKVSVDNAMLKVLDGYLNVEGNQQENYARELLELYSIGRGLEGIPKPSTGLGDYFVFKEKDVQEGAKILSGWDLATKFEKDALGNFIYADPDTKLPRGKVKGSPTNASAHDNSAKTLSDRLGNKPIAPDPLLLQGGNATEASALDEISQLIEQIYAQPETAMNICRRIYRFYVYHVIAKETAPNTYDTTIDDTIIKEMANVFKANGYKLQPVLEDLFKSQHFYDAAGSIDDDNFGGIIKSPLDLVVGTYRMFDIKLPPYTDSSIAFNDASVDLLRTLNTMGMDFYNPFDVSGFDAYHQFPIFHRSWISVNYLAERYNFIAQLTNQKTIDPIKFVRAKFSNAIASNAKQLVIELAKYLLPMNENLTYTIGADANSGLTAARMNYFLTTFLGTIDMNPEAAWTNRWNNNLDPETVENQLRNLFNAMMQSPEYQLY
jgi:uncharacterized protein (DUF1800 family)